MFANMKRFTAFLLALVMVFSLLPTGFIPADATEEEPQELTQAAYAEADLIFDQLDAAEEGPNKKNQTKEEAVEAVEAVEETAKMGTAHRRAARSEPETGASPEAGAVGHPPGAAG